MSNKRKSNKRRKNGRGLKPLRGDIKPSEPFIVCDIEAREWTKFLVIGLYDGETFREFRSITEFLAYVLKHYPGYTCYAHFGGGYDFLFLIREAFFIPWLRIKDMIGMGSGLLCFTLSDGTREVNFSDSLAFLPFGLQKLTEKFDVTHKKQELDHSKTTRVTKKLLEYLRFDCMGHYEVIEKYRNWPLIQKAGHRPTMASQALQVLRLYIKEPIEALADEHDVFVRRAYFGGRTEIFRPLHISKKPIHCYDVNSLYPTVMRANDFPNKCKGFTYLYDPNAIGFYEATVEVPKDMFIPPLGTMQKIKGIRVVEGEKKEVITEKFIFPTGRFRGYWSTIELEYARSIGVKIISTGKGVTFTNGGPIFRDFIDTLYAMRLKAKKEKDDVSDLLTKLLMNSCYGRFGLKKDRENVVIDDGVSAVLPYVEIETPHGIIQLAKKAKRLDKSFTNVAIAAWVTSLSRIHMHKIYRQCPRGTLYYTDTDSIYTTKKFPSGKGLGELDLEDTRDRACFLLPKTYLKEGNDLASHMKKVVMKGFDKKKIQKFTFEDFRASLQGEIGLLKTTVDPRFARFKTALKNGKLLMMTEESSKEIRSQYDKRKIVRAGKHYTTKPLYIETGP